jgi:hypothetical protein
LKTKKQKLKLQKETALPQGEEPDFDERFMQVPRARALHLARRGEASARVWAFLSPPYTRLEEAKRTIFKYSYLHFNQQGGT